MSNGMANLVRRSIAERTTTTLLRQRHTATATSGASAVSSSVGPASGKRWLITNAVVVAQYDTSPSSQDSGEAFGEVLGSGPDVTFVAAGAYQDNEESFNVGEVAPNMVLEFGDEARINVNAAESDFDITGTLTFWGFEYDDIV